MNTTYSRSHTHGLISEDTGFSCYTSNRKNSQEADFRAATEEFLLEWSVARGKRSTYLRHRCYGPYGYGRIPSSEWVTSVEEVTLSGADYHVLSFNSTRRQEG